MAEFEDFQLESIDGRKFITQRESAPGVLDIAARPVRRKDINADGNGFDPTQRFTEHLPDGFDASVGVALVGDEGTFGGNFMPRYSEVALDLPQICGAAGLISTATLADGRIKKVWRFPNGVRDIETLTAWFGQANKTWLLRYGKLMTYVIESDRTGETGGNKSYHFNSALRNQSEPDTTPQNAKHALGGTNVSGDVVLAVSVNGGAAQNVTLAIGDNAAAIDTKITALANVESVNVTGEGIVAASGAGYIVSGAGDAASNGTYIDTGFTNGGKPLYRLDANYDLKYEVAGFWVLATAGSIVLYRVASTSATPPANGWFAENGDEPAPTVRASAGGAAQADALIEFTNPANTPVNVTKVSGTNYTIAQTQQGGDGTGPDELGGSYIEPTHWHVLKAATKAELDAINMGDADTPIDEDSPNLVKTATAHSISLENLAQAVWLEDGKVNPGSHITRRPTVGASLTLAVQQDGARDYAEEVYATENFGGCGVDPFWLRFLARCDERELWVDFYCARNQQAGHPAQEGLAQWQFPLTRIHNAAGSLFFTTIEPAP